MMAKLRDAQVENAAAVRRMVEDNIPQTKQGGAAMTLSGGGNLTQEAAVLAPRLQVPGGAAGANGRAGLRMSGSVVSAGSEQMAQEMRNLSSPHFHSPVVGAAAGPGSGQLQPVGSAAAAAEARSPGGASPATASASLLADGELRIDVLPAVRNADPADLLAPPSRSHRADDDDDDSNQPPSLPGAADE